LSRNRRALLLLTGGIGSLLLTFMAQGYLRYIYASLLLLCAVLVLPLEDEKPALRWLTLSTIGLCVIFNLAFLPSGTWTYRHLPFHLIFNERAREDYLQQVAPLRLLIPIVNAHNYS